MTLDCIEAITNAVCGLLMGFVAVQVLWPILGWTANVGQSLAVTAIFFTLSVVRSYALRRIFRHLEETQ